MGRAGTIPIVGGFQPNQGGGWDGFVAKFNPTGNLMYSSYLGGRSNERAYAVALDAEGYAFVTGFTESDNFPTTPGAYQRTNAGNTDGFVVKVSPDGARLAYGTYFGERMSAEHPRGIGVDGSGNAYVTGFTQTNFQLPQAQAFVTKFNASGSQRPWFRALGGQQWDEGVALAVSSAGDAHVTGTTNSANFPITPDAIQPARGGARDGFITRLDPNGGVVYSSYFGGNGDDAGLGIALDSRGNIYVTGETRSTNLSTTEGAFQRGFGGGPVDAFVVKMSGLARLFTTAANYAAGPGPRAVTQADFNNDGVPDLAVANETTDTVTVLLGLGDGSFVKWGFFGTGLRPVAVATGDFNGDGAPDVVTANQISNTVSVLLGNGDGLFQDALNQEAGLYPTDVRIEDLNGDGLLDLVVANYGSAAVSVHLGNGDGTFQKPLFSFANGLPVALTAGDFNADGLLDLVVAHPDTNTVGVLLGLGKGHFGEVVNYRVGDRPLDVTAADFNGDGILDLAVANQLGPNVSVLLGNGDGTFARVANHPSLVGSVRIKADDFNLDGALDLVTVNPDSNSVSVLLGNGDGTFQSAVYFDVGKGPSGLTIGDLNLDGGPDVATANTASEDVSILLNTLGRGGTPGGGSAPGGGNGSGAWILLDGAGAVAGVSAPGQAVALPRIGAAPGWKHGMPRRIDQLFGAVVQEEVWFDPLRFLSKEEQARIGLWPAVLPAKANSTHDEELLADAFGAVVFVW